ncbi:MAG: PTS-dependent dihydroxyacetone kinase phosphotransferase subunit DhaM [Selenomonadaceae bacterium]|nr:PTS-dependent dihydroxyacetone kinase phosphotransferase subunit DhaM [Selenomonadaceae bacterium]
MVGIVVASHSRSLAEGVVEVARMMAPDVPIIAAGGMDDGSMGTSCRKIIGAVKQVYSDDGVALIADIGSSILSAEMAVEILKRPNLKIVDCPIVEGAVIAAVESKLGKTLAEIETSAIRSRTIRKLT